MTDWLIACLVGLGELFLNPLFYLSLIVCWWIGSQRVKQERRNFNTKILDSSHEWQGLLPQGLLWGLILSIITLGTGLAIPIAAMIILTAVTLVLALTFQFRFLSPAYTFSLTLFIVFFIYQQNVRLPIWNEYFEQLEKAIYPTLAILLGLLLIAEGFIIQRNGAKIITPQFTVSKRGQTIGLYASRRIWLLPMFVFIPGGDLAAPFTWYPIFSIGEAQIAPIVLPVIIGFTQNVQGTIPEQAVKAHGKQVVSLGFFMTVLALLSYWYPVLAIVTAILALVGRELIYYLQKTADDKRPFYFSQSAKGVKILGVIPHTPADKMGLEKGEIISKINGVVVKTEAQLYQALQKNRAHCKLEVIGNNGEMRLVQRALFEGEHYELGLLFVESQLKDLQVMGQ
ncbi:PDZ domain-containing protein [Peribacillus asahii]|uniref:PDZ domain-containing protein n=1 Tax=Peribacillus asahii TaxID=228899 RepID=UPI00380BB3D6